MTLAASVDHEAGELRNSASLTHQNEHQTDEVKEANYIEVELGAQAEAQEIKQSVSNAELEPKVDGDHLPVISNGVPKTILVREDGTVVPAIIKVIGGKGSSDSKPNEAKYGSTRHMIAILSLSMIVLANANRQAFNQALTSMVRVKIEDPIDLHDDSDTTINPTNLYPTTTLEPETTTIEYLTIGAEPINSNETASLSINPAEVDEDRLHLTPGQVALLQGAFSYGYTPFMILGGRLSEIYGAKWVVFASGFGSAMCCLFAPLFADTSFYLLVLSRVMMGLSQTGISPSLYAVMSRWLPSDESNLYLPLIKVAVQLGFMLGSLASGFLQWRVTFYVVGLVGLFWSLIWVLAASSVPDGHRFISKKELLYINQELDKQRIKTHGADDQDRKKQTSAPWVAIFTNPVVLAFMFAKFTVKLSTDAQSVQIPYYLDKVFNVSQELNGILSAMNFAIQGIFTGLVAYAAKEFVARKTFGLSKTGVRRLFQGVCNFGMALAYILMTFSMGSLEIVCCSIVILSVFSMFGAGGEPLTPIDLSIEFSASIMAIANSAANLSGIILPQIVSLILGDEPASFARWNMVLMVVAGVIIGGGILYCCIVTAEQQDFRKKLRRHNQKFQLEMTSP